MSKNVMFYGLLVAGGLFAYYAFKKNSISTKKNTLTTSTSGTFVDDVSVLQSIGNSKLVNQLVGDVKNSVSQIVEPFIGTQKKDELI
jgi:hypothetical protein